MMDWSRVRVIQVWFGLVTILGAAITLRVDMHAGTAAMLLALSMAPPGILLLLWPAAQPLTAAEVIRGY